MISEVMKYEIIIASSKINFQTESLLVNIKMSTYQHDSFDMIMGEIN